ncbi:MAG: UDP-N-acetylmuramoyl-L-alanine--D-glutamate ligase [Candidatus Hydrogenedentes bacterium]|nr:UDP-N-acetylmuramoyl-L-alanine--D-glutamate ligase [Candidatus Hydrogenedentota bacterium]
MRGRKVTVVGLGRTAVSLVRLLLREGARPFVTEVSDTPKVAAYRAELDTLGVFCECGGHTDAAFEDAVLVIPSPGVSPRVGPIARAREAGAEVLGEMEVAFAYCQSRVLAVTGTNGKTTTTELLKTLIESCGHRVVLAGNNAFPFSEAVQISPAPEYVVVEVSSYQLETIREFRPWIAAALNVTPDHLSRHGSMETYSAVKARIFENQSDGDISVVNYDDPAVRGMADERRGRVWPFSLATRLDNGIWLDGSDIRLGGERIARASDTILPGRHNLQNVLAALSMMRAGGFDWGKTLAGLREFRGVEHRIEFVARIGGVDFYNDSKSTNIDSLKVALESFSAPVILIAGGEGKGADYRVLRDSFGRRVKALVTLGDDAPLLEAAFGDLAPTERAEDMDDAVLRAAAASVPGDVVLLSPACASFDMYESFEHRGKVFKESVIRYRERALQ